MKRDILLLHQAQLIECLERVCLRQFNDADVRLLLTELRPYIPEGRVRQLVHSIAHPDRINTGALHAQLEMIWRCWEWIAWTKTGLAEAKVLKLPKGCRNALVN